MKTIGFYIVSLVGKVIIDDVNFNVKKYLAQDYENFKKYISAASYPRHVDYLNNDYAPDLIKFMQSKISGRKNASYYGFLQAIGEKDLPAFDDRQEAFVKYVSEMLPIVRPYEYLIIQKLIFGAGKEKLSEIKRHVQINAVTYDQTSFDVALGVEMDEYLRDLLEYGLGKFDIDFSKSDGKELFLPWAKYRKEQVQQLLLKNPKDIMLGTKIYDGIVYIYVTIIKGANTKEDLKYEDGYIDPNTFRWETVAHISDKELNALKESKLTHIFVRKVDNEDGIQLPFTYIGSGKMEYIENSKKANGAHLFRTPMNRTAPEDLYFDFKLPE